MVFEIPRQLCPRNSFVSLKDFVPLLRRVSSGLTEEPIVLALTCWSTPCRTMPCHRTLCLGDGGNIIPCDALSALGGKLNLSDGRNVKTHDLFWNKSSFGPLVPLASLY